MLTLNFSYANDAISVYAALTFHWAYKIYFSHFTALQTACHMVYVCLTNVCTRYCNMVLYHSR